MTTHKICAHCRECKPLEDFSRHPSTVDRRQSWCRKCMSANGSRWNRENRERRNEIQRDYRARKGVGPAARAKWLAIARAAAGL